nr:uncharacterized protein LOC127299027 isoform X2 [Lolium perenne]
MDLRPLNSRLLPASNILRHPPPARSRATSRPDLLHLSTAAPRILLPLARARLSAAARAHRLLEGVDGDEGTAFRTAARARRLAPRVAPSLSRALGIRGAGFPPMMRCGWRMGRTTTCNSSAGSPLRRGRPLPQVSFTIGYIIQF